MGVELSQSLSEEETSQLPEFTRRLSLVFERERNVLFAVRRRLLSKLNRRTNIQSRSPTSVRLPFVAQAQGWRWRGSAAAWMVSVTVHGLLLAIVLTLTTDPAPQAPRDESRVTIRWIAPPERVQKQVAPKPLTPPPQEVTVETKPTSNAPPSPPPQGASTEPEPPSPSPPHLSTQRLHSLGVGASPPGLPPRAVPGVGLDLMRSDRTVYAHRGRGKAAALDRFGGDAKTEDAVSRGLVWLAAHQDPGGGWRAAGFPRHCGHSAPCKGVGSAEFDVGVSGLAILAFLGAGHIPKLTLQEINARGHTPDRERSPVTSPYAEKLRSALARCLASQDQSGAFGRDGMNFMYNHAIASLAVIEAYALTGSPSYRRSANAALSFTLAAQQLGGGWDYTERPTGRNDLSITGWQIMALVAARGARLDVPEKAVRLMRDYLARAVTPQGIGIYSNSGPEAGRRGINMVAVGLLSTLLLGELPQSSRLMRAADRLVRPSAAPKWQKVENWDKTFQSYYYWYTATLALFHYGAGTDRPHWEAWNLQIKRTLLSTQSHSKHESGSWPPESNWVGISGGRVYATAINVLTLETYYRYATLDGSTAKVVQNP